MCHSGLMLSSRLEGVYILITLSTYKSGIIYKKDEEEEERSLKVMRFHSRDVLCGIAVYSPLL